MEPAPVTVGLDGTPESLAAAHWAATEADRRALPLHLLHAWILHVPEPAGLPAERDRDHWAKRILGAARTEITERFPGLPVVEELVSDEPAAALLDAAGRSEMVVLGSRGLARMQSFFLGDVALHVAGRAERPVVLVRAGMGEQHPHGGVVAGISLRGRCDELLGFAFCAAAARGVPLRVVHGRTLPVQAYAPWGVDPDIAQDIGRDAERELTAALRPWCETYPDVTVVDTVRLESPAQAVVNAADGADLLIVGRRRQRAALRPRLDAVVQACAHHARCPVAVVPHD
ncbi:universal stress protein [Streptomyces sp. NPDC049555]|uniref:universal stress protein n=1 Tax=unclassified Streptomyces TaxID=2593676 RepID=UPI003425DA30